MAKRVILIPNATTMQPGPDGRPIEHHTPDFKALGATDLPYTVKTNYRDVAKYEITGQDKELNELAQKSRDYFNRVWGKKKPEDE